MEKDLFISHSSKDKEKYIIPLCQHLEKNNISYWLDSIEIGWGDNLVDKINDGITSSKYALICLSQNFLESNWTNSEFTSMYAIQNDLGQKKVLPLILNSKSSVLKKYPLLSSISYKDFSIGIDAISKEITTLINPQTTSVPKNTLKIKVESKYTGKQFDFKIPINSSFKFLKDKAINVIGLDEHIDIGASSLFKIKWVLVDSKVDTAWKNFNKQDQSKMVSCIQGKDDILEVYDEYARLIDWEVSSGTIFYFYAVEDDENDSTCYAYE